MSRIRPGNVIRLRHALFLLCISSAFLSSCGWHHAKDTTPADFLDRHHLSDVRVMSWNVKRNSIFPPDGVRHESFIRIVQAIDPDVIGLQEVIRPGLVEELTQLMNRYIPLQDGMSWQVHAVADNALISRYPMRQQGGELAVPNPIPQWGLPDFHFGYASALVDLPEKFGGADLYVVAMHNKSGARKEEVQMRQIQSDSTVRWLRNLRDSDQANALANNTPIVILGDMNAVPDASMQPLETLLSGNIVDEKTFGPDFAIDWDGTDLVDARPGHNALEQSYYTWRNDDLPFAPSALDRILFSDSVMSARQRFVLNTMTMLADELADRGLEKTDVLYGGNTSYYDHLPLVADFAISTGSLK
jgi:endonuclease/exonuclease/phosphatase family metal-dependent hydrolase